MKVKGSSGSANSLTAAGNHAMSETLNAILQDNSNIGSEASHVAIQRLVTQHLTSTGNTGANDEATAKLKLVDPHLFKEAVHDYVSRSETKAIEGNSAAISLLRVFNWAHRLQTVRLRCR